MEHILNLRVTLHCASLSACTVHRTVVTEDSLRCVLLRVLLHAVWIRSYESPCHHRCHCRLPSCQQKPSCSLDMVSRALPEKSFAECVAAAIGSYLPESVFILSAVAFHLPRQRMQSISTQQSKFWLLFSDLLTVWRSPLWTVPLPFGPNLASLLDLITWVIACAEQKTHAFACVFESSANHRSRFAFRSRLRARFFSRLRAAKTTGTTNSDACVTPSGFVLRTGRRFSRTVITSVSSTRTIGMPQHDLFHWLMTQ